MENIIISTELSERLAEIRRIYSLSYDELTDEAKNTILTSEKLGRNGWTIGPDTSHNDEMSWLRIIESGEGEEEITEYYSDLYIDKILDKLITHYNTLPESNYLAKAIDNYLSGRYTESAMLFLSILDYRMKKLTPEFRKFSGISKTGIPNIGEDKYSDLANRQFTRIFLIVKYLPSLRSFCERVFCEKDTYVIGKGSEPPYLNRNWLMHGCSTRRVKKYDCIQLINALNTLLHVESIINDFDD